MPLRGWSSRGGASDAPSLVDRRRPFFTGVHRFGVAKWSAYLQDPFHTLLNLPWGRFLFVFFAVYISGFITFALIYLAFPTTCTVGIDGSFAHALWMSSRTASTIGFNQIYPRVTCVGANLVVMVQVICSSLIDMVMLGLVFARFSAPFKRASSIRFSAVATLSRHASGAWALTLRVANIRKHQLLQPEIQVLVTAIDSITPSNYVFQYLKVEALEMQQMNLQLGFVATLTHLITPSSPLYNLSLAEMDARMMEVLVFVDSIDAMTSKTLQARRSYQPAEMAMNQAFLELHLEMRGGKLGLDFSQFDATTCATDDLLTQYQASPQLKGMSMPEVQHHMAHLRHLTFRRLAEQATRPPGGAAGAASSSSSVAEAGSDAAAVTDAAPRGAIQLASMQQQGRGGIGGSTTPAPAGGAAVNPFANGGLMTSVPL